VRGLQRSLVPRLAGGPIGGPASQGALA
jgi:hypothetical protein